MNPLRIVYVTVLLCIAILMAYVFFPGVFN